MSLVKAQGRVIGPVQPQAVPEVPAALCSERVMDSVPLVMRFIRANVGDEGSDSPSVAQLRILSYLCDYPDSSLSDVVRFLGVTKATASNTVARMVDKALVERVGDPNERRCVVLNITDEGRRQYSRARLKAQAAVAQVLGGLTVAETEKIAEGLLLLRHAFARQAGLATPTNRGTSS
jgi:DNA-binding MarR family transcriptional regulator